MPVHRASGWGSPMHLLRYHLTLLSLSITWLTLLLCHQHWWDSRVAFWTTAFLLLANFLYSAWTLCFRASVPIALNLTQLFLFGFLHLQLATALGRHHYEFERPPRGCDWFEFTAAHMLRAVDLLDALDEYGVDLQQIRHRSLTAGILLVVMHLSVDIFLFSLVARRLARCWARPIESKLHEERKICGWLLLAMCCYVLSGMFQGWSVADWLLWPLENLLRTLDIGDAFQVFHWQLHQVRSDAWNASLAILFRLSLGMFLARVIALVRVTRLQGLGLTTAELIEELQEGDCETRQGAAEGLGRAGSDAEEAVRALGDALRHDGVAEVRRAAARSLGKIDSQEKLPALLAALDEIHEEVRASAIAALVDMGEDALPSLAHRLRHHRCSWVRRAAAEAIVGIGGPTMVPCMLTALNDPHEVVRLFAIATLADLEDPRAVEALFARLNDDCPEVRQAAWDALRALSALLCFGNRG